MHNILIVDDESMIRNGMKAAVPWHELGVTGVFVAGSGFEALELLQLNRIDIMITDINMTEMTGLELIAKAKELQENLRIIVLSGYDDFEYVRQSLRMHVVDYLLKPIDESVLENIVSQELDALDSDREVLHAARWQQSLDSQAQVGLERILVRLLHEKEVSGQEFDDLASRYPDYVDAVLQVLVLMPSFSGTEDENTDYLARVSMKDICVRTVDCNDAGITVMDTDRMVVSILCPAQIPVPLSRLQSDLLQEIGKAGLPAPKMFCGSEVNGLRELHISKRDALFSRNRKKERLLHELVVKRSRFGGQQYVDAMERIKQNISADIADKDRVFHAYELFCDIIEVFNVADGQVLRDCYELVNTAYYAYFNATMHEIPEGRLCRLLKLISLGTREQALEICFSSLLELYSEHLGPSRGIVEQARYYIVQHLGEELTISAIAERFKVSPNYFSRLFKRVSGEGCNNYIVRKRMEMAKGLLQDTNFPCGKIASMVGYRDINYFSLSFKKQVGCSPSAYRQRVRSRR
jgi:two-component system response regulator YesN